MLKIQKTVLLNCNNILKLTIFIAFLSNKCNLVEQKTLKQIDPKLLNGNVYYCPFHMQLYFYDNIIY